MSKSILHLYKRALPDSKGGIENTIDCLSKSDLFKDCKIEVFSASANKTQRFTKGNITYTFIKEFMQISSTPLSIKFLILGILRVRHADIVYLHYPFPLIDLIALFRRKDAKLILYYHSDIVNKMKMLQWIYAPLEHITKKTANRVVVSSKNLLKTSPGLRNFQNKSVIIPPGICDLSQVAAKKPNKNFEFERPYFVFVGVLRHYKGLNILIDAAKKASIDVVIVGDGSLKNELEAKVISSEIKYIHFFGELNESEKAYCIQHAAALILPSFLRSEAFGLSLVEGLAMGKPLISTELGTGTSWVNKDGKTGFVVQPKNSDALAQAMKKIIAHPKTAREFGTAARKRYLEKFTEHQMATSHKILIEQIS
jgi:rhamnosyl/mannosyltransferase